MPTVAELERIAFESWRGLEHEKFGDWLLRAGGGFTGRANSALVVGEPPAALPDAVAAVTRWYAGRGLRPRAQVPLPGLEAADAAFAAAGWDRDEDVLVLTARVAGWPPPSVDVVLAPEPDDDWLTGYRYRGSALPPVARDVLLAADDPAFVTVRLDPAPPPRRPPSRAASSSPAGWSSPR